MTTITIKINERSKKGKAFLEFAKTFFAEGKDVEIIKPDDKKPKKEESPYNPEFVAEILERSKDLDKKKLTRLNTDDIWGSIL